MPDLHRMYRPIQPPDAGRAAAAYREAFPSPALAPFVACFWTMEETVGAIHRVVPDGCMDMLFEWRPDRPDVRRSICGAFDRPFDAASAAAGRRYFGIRFFPGGLYRLFRVPSAEFTDRLVPLDDVAGAQGRLLAERLSECGTFAERVAAAERFLLDALRRGTLPETDAAFGNALYELFRSEGAAPIAELARSSGVGERALNRLFGRWTGLAPKTFARIVRFQLVLSGLERGFGPDDWAGAAARYGFADQAHLIRDFRSLYGDSPAAAGRSLVRR
ncbi:DUF6597 domain-containing transcriptional factor [Paenibacillus flagellatus]|nr:DUF6597 domain-containing transcriptional factor [Paenibacillus flagellatus]